MWIVSTKLLQTPNSLITRKDRKGIDKSVREENSKLENHASLRNIVCTENSNVMELWQRRRYNFFFWDFPMAIKRGRMIFYLEEFLIIKLYHPLIRWSSKITWQAKAIISPLAQCLWPPNLLRWWYTLSGSLS